MTYKNLAALSNDDLRDLIDENPRSFLKNFAQQLRHELMGDIVRQEQEKARKAQQEELDGKVSGTFQKFADEHPEFTKLWDSGEIQEFIDKHTGHNALSAFLEINNSQAVERGVAEALADHETNSREKAELNDTKEHGGLNRVLLDRVREQRESSRGSHDTPEDDGALLETVPPAA